MVLRCVSYFVVDALVEVSCSWSKYLEIFFDYIT